ncbi:MAG TPA: ribonuclease J [Candidatus Saccharimonadia bacterium]|nr:ribonuclease J [Candidatus Saccharimonadia bacterium]
MMAKSHTDLVPSVDAMPVNKSIFNGSGGTQQSKKAGLRPERGPANQVVREPTIRIIPLGGLGEIGKNMTAIEFGNDIVILDIGFAFPKADQPGVDYIIPDVSYLERNRHKVRAIIITHGHMDHIGAAGYMIPKFPVPVYGSRLSLGMVAKQIEEFKIRTPQFVVMNPDKHERVQLGVFNIELVRVTHTIADSTAIVLRTPVGTIIDTGDWRLDPDPLDGKMMDMDRLAEIGREGVLLLMSDSTSCDHPGTGGSERVVAPTIKDLFGRANGRIIISTFSSSITRVQLIIDATHEAGRRLAIVGRSMLSTIELCIKMGYLKVPQGVVVRVQDTVGMPDGQVVILCTGSQGEENAALVRMSTGDHQNVKIKPGDSVIFSSSVIPGNEVAVVTLVDNLMREGAQVYARSTEGIRGHGPLHVGGHAKRDDVATLVSVIKPKYFMPIHGEFHHLVYNAEVAVENGVPRENVFVMDNGDVLELTAKHAAKGGRVPAGMVMVDGSGVGDVEGVVLRDRLAMGGDGVFMIVATVSRKTGKLLSSPDIISRGFIYMKENEDLVNKARAEVRRAFEKRNPKEPIDWAKFKLRLRDEIGDLLYSKTKRNPMILPVINEV